MISNISSEPVYDAALHDSMYASDGDSDASALPPLPTPLGNPLSSAPWRLVDDEPAQLSDDNLGSHSRASTPGSLDARSADDFNPGGIFDTPAPTPVQSDNEEAMEDLPQIDHDPLFETSEALFDTLVESGSDDLVSEGGPPPAFDEDPLIRNAYVSAYLLASCHGSTQEAVKAHLDALYESFVGFQRRTGIELRGLENMARTLQTAERRLRIDPNEYILYYFLCTVCWARHHPSALYELGAATCATPGCSGTLYSMKKLTDGHLKRTPLKVLPTAPIIPMIQLFLLRPGKYQEFQHWRIPGLDDMGEAAPLDAPHDPLNAYENIHCTMGDITDAWGWRAVAWGLERRKVSTAVSSWGVEDVLVEEKRQRFVSLPCGLLFSINLDWYVASSFLP